MKFQTFCVLACAVMLVFTSVSTRAHAAAAEQPATCPHKIETSNCPFCDPDRIERLGGCKEHGVPEALCVKCRPYLKTAFIAKGDWCKDHDTPESQCALCNPDIAKANTDAQLTAGVEHRWRHDPSPNCSTSSTTIKLASAEVVRVMGFEYTQVQASPLRRLR